MASNYTSNYSLCQWEATDKVLRTDFNADNAKIDAAIKAVDRRADSLQSTLSGHADALAGKGNCQVCATSYVGSGKCGVDNPNRLTFAQKPMVVFVYSAYNVMTLLQGMSTSWVSTNSSGGFSTVQVTWTGNSVSWYGSQTYSQLSYEGSTYHVLALLQAD